MGQTDSMNSLYDLMRTQQRFCRIPAQNARCQSSHEETSDKLKSRIVV